MVKSGLLHFAPGCGFQSVLTGLHEVKSNTISTKARTSRKIGMAKMMHVCRFVEAIRLCRTMARVTVDSPKTMRPKGTEMAYSLKAMETLLGSKA